MKRAKKKRKAKIKARRIRKINRGKLVPFTISNCPKTLRGIRNSYQYKVNVHNCSFKNAVFISVRYRSGHITKSSFKMAHFNKVDFISMNLKANKFRNAVFNNCLFFGCNLEGSDFEGAVFNNTYFVSCKLNNIKNFQIAHGIKIIKNYSLSNQLSSELVSTLHLLSTNERLEKYRIITTKENHYNKWLLELLLMKYPEGALVRFFKKLLLSNKTQFYSFSDYDINLYKYFNT